MGISFLLALVGILIMALFLDPMPDELQDKVKNTSTVWQETLELGTATLRSNAKIDQALLVPYMFLHGLHATFNSADWTLVSVTPGVYQPQ